MLNLLKYNESVGEWVPIPTLTNQPPFTEVGIMAKSFISKSIQTCQVEGCNLSHYGRGYCCRHYQQIKKRGHIFGDPSRSRTAKNDITLIKDSCIIDLYDIKGNKNGEAIVDIENYETIKKYKWSLRNGNGYGYVRAPIDGGFIDLAVLIIGSPPEGLLIDHADRDPLNNKISNLRFASKSQNAMNSKVRKDNSSGFKGVSLNRNKRKWRAYISINGQQQHLGTFVAQEDAINARKQAEKLLFNEFSSKA